MTYAEIKPYVASVRLFEDGTAHWRVYERGINGFTAEYKLAKSETEAKRLAENKLKRYASGK